MTITTSEQLNELATALSKAQGEFDPALKDSNNPFYKSKYADLPSVWAVSREVLANHGLCLMQFPSTSEGRPCLVTRLMHASGQWMQSSVDLLLTKNDIQGLGSAISYMRRYSMTAILGIVQDDDDGQKAVQNGKSQSTPVVQPKISKDQALELESLLALCSDEIIKPFMDRLNSKGISSFKDISANDYAATQKYLDAKAKENQTKYGEDAING